MEKGEDTGRRVVKMIEKWTLEAGENSLENGERAFGEPLVGFASGNDPLFAFFKKDIGPFHWTPREFFEKTFGVRRVSGKRLTVVSWVLPHAERTRKDQRGEKEFPCERWVRGKKFGENFNNFLRQKVADALTREGSTAAAPVLSPLWQRRTSPKHGLASCWSERHAAYACGLGTFGLSDGLITAAGKAMRCGSVITLARILPTPRPFQDHREHCLFHRTGACMKCAERCPAGAITRDGHDKEKCRLYIRTKTRPAGLSRFGLEVNSCGLCQTGVPCEFRVPKIRPDQEKP